MLQVPEAQWHRRRRSRFGLVLKLADECGDFGVHGELKFRSGDLFRRRALNAPAFARGERILVRTYLGQNLTVAYNVQQATSGSALL